MELQKIGGYAFILGVILAILAGIFPLNATAQSLVLWVMAVLGVIIGLLNITDKETTQFLVAAIALILMQGALSTLGASWLTAIVINLAALAAPAALIIALVSFFRLARS